MPELKLKFDGALEYQQDAVRAVIDLFQGQPTSSGAHEIHMRPSSGELFTELGVGNRLTLDHETLLSNVRGIQERNGIEPYDTLQGMHFSVEMETGTGKTYVYLRTLHEFHKRYGFRKFIIVVPSVAIREGVWKSLEMTREHFQDLYGRVPLDAWIYDRNQISRLRHFASGNNPQLLILNIDAFNKELNVIRQERDGFSGRMPLEFIQAVNPIVIMDEPQNMESDIAREAVSLLNPLCTLRYSATHRDPYNLLYRLDPVQAYDLRLVKRIEVTSVLDEEDFNRPYLQLKSVSLSKSGKISAKVEMDVQEDTQKGVGPKRKTVTLTGGEDLHEVSGRRSQYQGYIVEEIDAGRSLVHFGNDVTLEEGDTQGDHRDDVMQVQIRETVKAHLEKELEVKRKLLEGARFKVISLFFIDRVANYADEGGRIRRWFEEAYCEESKKERYVNLNLPPVGDVHNGYFARDRKGWKDSKGKARTKADNEAYALIMKDKERLLSLDEPLRFIFSHSALREGWDNPNVFQICTLNETRSEMKKRQEIGRGLRLPVLETGERCADPNLNILTVIANEGYEDFARQLQTEFEEECGVDFGGRIKPARERRALKLKRGWEMDPEFLALWERIQQRTRYAVEFDTETLVRESIKELRKAPEIEAPTIRTGRGGMMLTRGGVNPEARSTVRAVPVETYDKSIPDLLTYLQEATELTRSTLARILIESGRLGEVHRNPQKFLDQIVQAIKRVLNQLIVEGIKYEKIAGSIYEMRRFEEEEIVAYVSNLVDVERSIYDAVTFDSEVEERFARELDGMEDIRLFFKLPSWFKVDTPIGDYNPDWAIVKGQNGELARVYLVAETKGSLDWNDLRNSERMKIDCGAAHFAVLDSVEFKPVTKASEV